MKQNLQNRLEEMITQLTELKDDPIVNPKISLELAYKLKVVRGYRDNLRAKDVSLRLYSVDRDYCTLIEECEKL